MDDDIHRASKLAAKVYPKVFRTELAKQLIVERSPDAVPGHSSLVNDELIHAITLFGSERQITPSDSRVLQPAN